jgi:hypothetical protein
MSDIVQQLRERIDELEEELRQLRADIKQTDTFGLGFLSHQEVAIMRGIYSRQIASYAYLDQLTADTHKYHRYSGEVSAKLRCKVAVWKIRLKLKPYDIEIKTWRGIGYYLDEENKAKLKQLMEKKDD